MQAPLLRLGVRGALLLPVCGLFLGSACSFLVDSKGQQCKSQDDCKRHGEAFANYECRDSVCVSPSGSGGTTSGSSESSGGNGGGNSGSSLTGSSNSGGAGGGSAVDNRDAGSGRDANSGSTETGNDSHNADARDAGRDYGVDANVRDSAADAPVDVIRPDSDGGSDDASRWSDWNAFLPLASGSTTNGDPGTTPDVSGHGYFAMYSRGISFSNSTMIMSGGGDVSIPSQASIPAIDVTTSYSISVWITMTATTGWRTFLSAEGTQVSEFYLQKRSDTSHFAFTLSTADNNEGVSQPCVASSSIAPVSGVRYHLVATRDATTGVNTLYVNGALAGTATCTVSRGVAWPANTFAIGRGMYNGLPADYFAGSMSAVGLVNRVLTDAEVAELFALGP